RVPGGLLGLGVEGQLDGRPPPLPAGEDVGDAVVEQRIGLAGEGVVQRALDPGEAVHHRVVAGHRGVHRAGIVGAQVAVGVVGGLGDGDRMAVHDDRAAMAAVLVVQGAVVLSVGVEAILGDHLEVRGRGEQQHEQHADHEPDVAQRPVHAPTSWTGCGPAGAPAPGTCRAAGRRAASERRTRMPVMIQLHTSELPPAARKGSVRPVSGITRVTPPTTTKTCSAITKPRPPASSVPKPSEMPTAARSARWTSSRYSSSSAKAPTIPSSSAKEAKMKSDSACGTTSGRPSPRPAPVMPPLARPNRPWLICSQAE